MSTSALRVDVPAAAKAEAQGSTISPTDAARAQDQLQSDLAGLFSPSAFKFDLPLCVSLAGSAFEAYFKADGGLEEHDATTGNNITYIDKDYLRETRQGLLCIHLIRAKGLRAADLGITSDPFAVLSVGASAATSAVVENKTNPQWKEQYFVLFVKDLLADSLKIDMFDEDLGSRKDDLGNTSVTLSSLTPGITTELTLPLAGPGGKGEVVLSATLLPFTDSLLEAVTASHHRVAGDAPSKYPAGKASKDMYELVLGLAAGTSTMPAKAADDAVMPETSELRKQAGDKLTEMGLLDAPGGPSTQDVDASPWKALARIAGSCQLCSWEPVVYIDNQRTETQAWIHHSITTRELVISFRGTEQAKGIRDWLTDLNARRVQLKPDGEDKPYPDVLLHKGFADAYDSVKGVIRTVLDDLCRRPAERGGQALRVYVAGHSLGGALATLCAWDVSTRASPLRAKQSVTMYNFGSPRVGNQAFTELYNRRVPDSWRVTNCLDIVVTVPRWLGWEHVRRRVKINVMGKIRVQAAHGEDVFGQGRVGLLRGLIDREEDGSEDQDKMSMPDLRDESTLSAIGNLLTLKSAQAHMGDLYLKALQNVVTEFIRASKQDTPAAPQPA